MLTEDVCFLMYRYFIGVKIKCDEKNINLKVVLATLYTVYSIYMQKINY